MRREEGLGAALARETDPSLAPPRLLASVRVCGTLAKRSIQRCLTEYITGSGS